MEDGTYWVPYRVDEPGCPYIVVGPFRYQVQAKLASDAMKRAARGRERVGDVLTAQSEEEALLLATTYCPGSK